MPSNIDETQPTAGTATTQSVRDNFSAAKTEIEALQTTDHAAVTLAGEDYLTLSAQEITAVAIDLDNLSATGAPSSSTYLRGDNTWATIAGGGDVAKVGTPVNNQLGVWTGDGTLEGDADLTWDTTELIINATAPRQSITAAAGNGAILRICGNGATPGTGGVDINHSGSDVAYVHQRANANLNLRIQATDVLTCASSGAVTTNSTVNGRDMSADGTKLDGIETGADVTDTTNVQAAGALMDSEVDADIQTLTLPANTTISTFGASLVDDASASAARTTLGVDAAGTDNSTDVTLAGTPDYLTLSGQVITRNQIDLTTDVTGVLPGANGGAVHHASATLIDPEATDSITIFVPRSAITITGVSAHRQGGTSVAFNIDHGTNPSAPANALWSSDETVTANTTIDQSFAAFNDATVPADSAVKLVLSAVTGTVTEFHVTLEYTVD